MHPSFLGTALLLAVTPLWAQSGAADVQKIVQADYAARDTAFMQRDINATLAHYAPDFVGVSNTNKAHDLKEERADFLKTFALPAKSLVTKSTIEKFSLAKGGTEAIVTVHKHGILLFVDPQSKQNNVLVLDGVVHDQWTKRPAGWQLTHEQNSVISATMNGKPI